MSRSFVLGNGSILVGLDAQGQVRDFYFPHVGLENHVRGKFIHRIGVFVEGLVRWCNHPSWEMRVRSADDTFEARVVGVNRELQLELHFTTLVYNEKNIFLRHFTLKNLAGSERRVKLYLGHEFELYESHRGDTAYFDPMHHVLIHYKGRRVFLANMFHERGGFDDYTTGVFGVEGKEGSFRDAEDGMLSQNPIEHGRVDSVLGATVILPPHGNAELYYWLAVGESHREVIALNQYVLERTPAYLMNTTADFWRAWVNKYQFSFYGLSPAIIALFRKSLFIVRAHADLEGGIIASSDGDIFQGGKDTYAYMWPRDASFAAEALDRAGDSNVARRFFEFSNSVISDDGYFMHKYRSDHSLGSSWHPWVREGKAVLPIQEDGTALILIALLKHYEISKDLEFIESIYNSFIKKAATFLVVYRDEKTRLPEPSFDLWEEKFGTHTFTAAAVYGALSAAARFAEILGKKTSEELYAGAAKEVGEAILKHLYDAKTGMFHKMITFGQGGVLVPDRTIDISSVYGIFAFGVLPPGDPRLADAFRRTLRALTVPTPVGGIARYEGDRYSATGAAVPGNPWILTTLWHARYQIALARDEKELAAARDTLEWVARHALPSGVLSEQLDPTTGAQLSAAPLTWSHAEFVLTVIAYLNRLEDFGVCKACNPVG
ncbi:MAG: glycoside hydrolase 15-like protein [Parcubacteria group bacterium Gr01-1014_72]|nr:MAG: glycoside hydrolase 15-like protein [Parcubacteria group bacterium Gr01-1014_72]